MHVERRVRFSTVESASDLVFQLLDLGRVSGINYAFGEFSQLAPAQLARAVQIANKLDNDRLLVLLQVPDFIDNSRGSHIQSLRHFFCRGNAIVCYGS